MPISRRLGSLTITALEDGAGPFFTPRREAFPTATDTQWTAVDAFDPEAVTADGRWWLRFRAFAIVDDHGRTTIVDAGIGPSDPAVDAWTPVPGRLPGELAAAGIDVAAVETVVLTHLHSDHTGWAVVPGHRGESTESGTSGTRADGAAQAPSKPSDAAKPTSASSSAAGATSVLSSVVGATSRPSDAATPASSGMAKPSPGPDGGDANAPQRMATSGPTGAAEPSPGAGAAGRRPFFPNARYVIQRADAVSLAPQQDERLLVPLRRSGQLHIVEGDHRLSHEMTTVHTPGHTPGHQSVLLSHGNDSMLLTGDLLVHAVQLLFPELPYAHEDDPGLARRTRVRFLERVRRERGTLATSHLTEPFLPPTR